MSMPSLLKLGNARKIKENLGGILDSEALEKIENEIHLNTRGLFKLAKSHYAFATKQSNANWRQKTSRLYYAAYNAARAVRFFVFGEYSTDSKDHQKLSQLPDDFPNKNQYATQLPILRDDRNLCDYDHLARAGSLTLGSQQSQILVQDFLRDAEQYLRSKGLAN